jgi:CRISPR-associated endonuclease/helicase Cas3
MFVRLFGLAHKVIVIDEAHAYDVYMTTLLERLLEWLAALGCTVIILSATLPSARRTALLRAFACGAQTPDAGNIAIPPADYPRLTSLIGGKVQAIAVPVDVQSRQIALHWLPVPLIVDSGCGSLATLLLGRIADGGCAAVICNTVRRAQEVYRALKALIAGLADAERPALDLFHARYRFIERAARERRVLEHYGKPGPDGASHHRPTRSILIATQVIEQSLDLDFDVVVSELAPADLVLQRAGRLHRHERGSRPAPVSTPTLFLAPPESVGPDGVPHFGPSRYIYDPHILLRSWLALQGQGKTLTIPTAIEPLIEAVYDDGAVCHSEKPAIREFWEETREELRRTQKEYRKMARAFEIVSPYGDDDPFEDRSMELEEDNPVITPKLQALTRLSDVNVSTVVLYDTSEEKFLLGKSTPTQDMVKELLFRAVSIAHRRVATRLLEREPPKYWQDSAVLRHYRLIVVDAAGQYVDPSGDFSLYLDREYGLVIDERSVG